MQRFEISQQMMEPYEHGRFVRYEDAQAKSLADERRIKELESALRDMLEGHEDEDPNRPCIANARAALRVGGK